ASNGPMRSVCSAMVRLRAAGSVATSRRRRNRDVIGKLVRPQVRGRGPRMRAVAAIGVLASVIVAGCSALPTAGPTTSDVKSQEIKDKEVRFDLVDIDDNVVAALLASQRESFHTRFKKYGRPPQPRIGVGDSVVVSIWEAAGGGLFGVSAREPIS